MRSLRAATRNLSPKSSAESKDFNLKRVLFYRGNDGRLFQQNQPIADIHFYAPSKQGRNHGLVFFRVLLVGMAVFGALGGCAFLTTAACRHQAEEADQEHRTNQSGWGFHGKTLE
jgi:hypothetical protein